MVTYNDNDGASSLYSVLPDKPFEQTSHTEKLEVDDPLIALAGSHSAAAVRFRGTKAAVAQISASNGAYYPNIGPLSVCKLRFYFRIWGAPTAPRICIDVAPHESRRRPGYIMKVEFFPGTAHIDCFNFTMVDEVVLPSTKDRWVEIEWQTKGGVGTGLDYRSMDLDRESESIIKMISMYGKDCIDDQGRGRSLKMRVKLVDGLLSELTKLKANHYSLPPWHPYRVVTVHGNAFPPRCSIDTLQRRLAAQNLSGGSLIRYPAQNSFVDCIEAFIIMVNAMWIEYRKAPCHILRDSWRKEGGTSQVWFEKQFEALKCLLSSPCHTAWVPTFLNQNVSALPLYDLPCLPLSTEKSQISSAVDWSDDQKQALMIDRAFLLRGNIKMIEGGPGTDKSTVLAGIAASFASIGAAVLVVTPSRISGPSLMNKIDALLKNSIPASSSKSKINIVHIGDEIDCRRFCRTPSGYVANIDILVTTPIVVCSEWIVTNFGAKHAQIIVLHDDAHLLMEPEIIATIFCLKHAKKVCGLVMTTDVYEWPPSVASEVSERSLCTQKDHDHGVNYKWYWDIFNAQHNGDKELIQGLDKAVKKQQKKGKNCLIRYEGGVNEFANQLGLSFPTRLRRQMFPATRLITQHRLTDAMIQMPNSRIYNNALTAKDIGTPKDDIRKFKQFLRSWLSPNLPEEFSTVYVVATTGQAGACIKERGTTESKRNHYNVDVVYDLLSENFERKLIDPKDITIVTPYRDQARLYEQVFHQRGACGMLEGDHSPRVLTPDLTWGHQNRIIIYDLVVALGDSSHGIGIVGHEFKTNVAITRASDLLVIVGSAELVTVFPQFWELLCTRHDFEREPLPYIVEYATMLKKCGLSFPPSNITKRKPCDFQVQDEWHKDYSSFLEWEHSKNMIANQAGREHEDISWQDAHGLGDVYIGEDADD